MSWNIIGDSEVAAYAPNTGQLQQRIRDRSCFRFHDAQPGPGLRWLNLSGQSTFGNMSTSRLRYFGPEVNTLDAGNANLRLIVACTAEVTKATFGSFQAEFRFYDSTHGASNVHSLSGDDGDSPREERFFLYRDFEVSRSGLGIEGSTFRILFQAREVLNAGATWFGPGAIEERYHSATYGFQMKTTAPVLLMAAPR